MEIAALRHSMTAKSPRQPDLTANFFPQTPSKVKDHTRINIDAVDILQGCVQESNQARERQELFSVHNLSVPKLRQASEERLLNHGKTH
ncbi:MAG: hypothetical protein AB1589_02300 [Cyanobacteriota bacterium]